MTGRAIGTRLALAQARAEQARARLSETIGTLQHRASPQALAQDMAESLKARGVEAVLGAVDSARRRPARFGIAVAAIGLLLARGPIARTLRRRAATPLPKTGSRP
ncbi:MAG: DUF3618 domain-containing protein [Sphingomonas sp.]|jgi:hypothetical protein|uniref:DUF3618 domain-containing protein n=1 Tax=unclassified Sphingomonas TaxID=196159 RepID=UPI00053E86EB|nr:MULTISPECIES: DUF3618 domain-containing protein [unclassified Sphingomonas]MDR6849798.1 hypothetical protein [Sphingomonas sp. BE137]MDR7257299.1 hypothetical protein [Sphingomonas sp. BE270]RUN78165.1 DUF3618 domain-containing protein [Sphingomonas sp. TF3]